MGMSIGFSRSSFDRSPPAAQGPGNPDPRKYTIDRMEMVGGFLIMAITYPDCVNYEGKKILLFRGVTIDELLSQGRIDPHFSDNPCLHSPVARFEPTEEGWDMARAVVDDYKTRS